MFFFSLEQLKQLRTGVKPLQKVPLRKIPTRGPLTCNYNLQPLPRCQQMKVFSSLFPLSKSTIDGARQHEVEQLRIRAEG